MLSANDPEFQGLFKTVAEMEDTVGWTPESALSGLGAAAATAGMAPEVDLAGGDLPRLLV